MLRLSQTKVMLSCIPTDMRKSINGLSILVSDSFGLNPAEEYIFVFWNKRRDKLKALYWDRNGFCLYYKILEKGKFKLQESRHGKIELTLEQFSWLLDGLDFTKLKGHPRLHYDKYF